MEGEESTGQVLHDSNRLDSGDGSFPIKSRQPRGIKEAPACGVRKDITTRWSDGESSVAQLISIRDWMHPWELLFGTYCVESLDGRRTLTAELINSRGWDRGKSRGGNAALCGRCESKARRWTCYEKGKGKGRFGEGGEKRI